MKKTVAAFLSLSLAFCCLCGCGNGKTEGTSGTAAPEESLVSLQEESTTAYPGQKGSPFPAFKAKDVTGKTVTNKIFSKKKLTVVNVFSTWSGSNELELPALAALSKADDMKDIGFLGIVLDVAESGKTDEKLLEKAKALYEENGKPYPYLITDKALNGLCDRIYLLPQTFFVDAEGNIVGDAVSNVLTESNFRQFIEQRLVG